MMIIAGPVAHDFWGQAQNEYDRYVRTPSAVLPSEEILD